MRQFLHVIKAAKMWKNKKKAFEPILEKNISFLKHSNLKRLIFIFTLQWFLETKETALKRGNDTFFCDYNVVQKCFLSVILFYI